MQGMSGKNIKTTNSRRQQVEHLFIGRTQFYLCLGCCSMFFRLSVLAHTNHTRHGHEKCLDLIAHPPNAASAQGAQSFLKVISPTTDQRTLCFCLVRCLQKQCGPFDTMHKKSKQSTDSLTTASRQAVREQSLQLLEIIVFMHCRSAV